MKAVGESPYLAHIPRLPHWLLEQMDGRRKMSEGEESLATGLIYGTAARIRNARECYEARTGIMVDIEEPTAP